MLLPCTMIQGWAMLRVVVHSCDLKAVLKDRKELATSFKLFLLQFQTHVDRMTDKTAGEVFFFPPEQ